MLNVRLLRRVERFLLNTGMKPTRFGREVCNDPRLYADLREGRPGDKRQAKIEGWLNEQEKSQ